MKILSHRAAKKRNGPSLPAKIIMQYLSKPRSIFDFGCGYGDDIVFFKQQGIAADGYDPYWHPRKPNIESADLITCIFVLSVVPLKERKQILQTIRAALYTNNYAMFAVPKRNHIEKTARKYHWMKYQDGYITPRLHTFEKGFTTPELKRFLERNGFSCLRVWHLGSAIVILTKKSYTQNSYFNKGV